MWACTISLSSAICKQADRFVPEKTVLRTSFSSNKVSRPIVLFKTFQFSFNYAEQTQKNPSDYTVVRLFHISGRHIVDHLGFLYIFTPKFKTFPSLNKHLVMFKCKYKCSEGRKKFSENTMNLIKNWKDLGMHRLCFEKKKMLSFRNLDNLGCAESMNN